jgi:hypothetical protein
VGGVEDQVRAGVAVRDVGERLAPVFIGNRDGNQIGGRDGEILLVDRPRPRPADVLDTEHATHDRALAQRHVEHRTDPFGGEIRGVEFAGPDIGPRIVSRNDPL